MMLAKKYEDKFLNADTKNKSLKVILERIIDKEEEFQLDSINWENKHVEDFLRSQKSTSPNTLSRTFIFLKNFNKFVAQEEGIEYRDIKLQNNLDIFVDFETLLKTVLSYQEFQTIFDKIPNNRIKTLFALGWFLLSNDEIKNLKIDDIEFVDGIIGEEIVLKLEDRTVNIEDVKVVEAIKRCMNETKYHIVAKNQVEKTMDLVDSEYLIKPVVAGRTGDSKQVTNPSLTLQKALDQFEVKCFGIDVNKLSVEDIKRSKIIYLLHNKQFISKDEIGLLLGGGDKTSYLFWLEKISSKKYGN